MRRNTQPPPRIVLHEALLPDPPFVDFGARQTQTAFQQRYEVEGVLSRGTLAASLEAETDALAEQALDGFISRALPTMAFDSFPGILSSFWLSLTVLKIVAVHAVAVLDVTDDGLDGGAAAHLALGRGHRRRAC